MQVSIIWRTRHDHNNSIQDNNKIRGIRISVGMLTQAVEIALIIIGGMAGGDIVSKIRVGANSEDQE